jgi:dTDP-3-amino-2,3,6-trideoxy-4-keto-D-glucose/dTDP-3-amino-3,4,6-trideoxy-alpha-D-glucose/dTDP-2,6-dideoxy-D-kanosamine transaminase
LDLCEGFGYGSMPVPFNDLKRRYAASRQQLLTIWTNFLDDGVFIGGPAISLFEKRFVAHCGASHCVSLASGTDALELSLRALDVRPGDEVITVANAGGYTTSACHAIGAVPVYIDVHLTTCQFDSGLIEKALRSKTRAIVVTHLYGLMNDVTALRSQLRSLGREDIAIVEDCAQAHGASIDGQRAGTQSDIGAFSFYPTKNLGALGDAGAVTCRDADVANRVRQLKQYGWGPKYHVTLPGGRNSRMDPLQALILTNQLDVLAGWNSMRARICKIYEDNLPAGWSLVRDEGSRFVAHLAVAIAPNLDSRERACRALTQRSIGYDIHYPVLDCDQPAWKERGRIAGDLKISRFLTDRVLSLPCFPEMTDEELEQVVDAVRTF